MTCKYVNQGELGLFNEGPLRLRDQYNLSTCENLKNLLIMQFEREFL